MDWRRLNNNDSPRSMDWKSTAAQNAAFQLPGASSRADCPERDGLYGGGGARHHSHPDPHLVCLKLGKRHYFEDHVAAAAAASEERHVADKRGRSGGEVRCQVEGCHVALVNAKDYHRRHKVCEAHSKAPRVVVLGLEQRFCQQCSRFHAVSEFEESKRSCKRRLAGHNQRRRKSSHDSIARNYSSFNDKKVLMIGGGFPYMVSSPSTTIVSGRARSLLSSNADTSYEWVPLDSPDLSLRSSAALRELIAENRARQLTIESKNESWQLLHQLATEDFASGSGSVEANPHQMFPEPTQCWDAEIGGTHVTLDLMQRPNAPFGFVPPGARARAKAEGEEGFDLWNSFWKDI